MPRFILRLTRDIASTARTASPFVILSEAKNLIVALPLFNVSRVTLYCVFFYCLTHSIASTTRTVGLLVILSVSEESRRSTRPRMSNSSSLPSAPRLHLFSAKHKSWRILLNTAKKWATPLLLRHSKIYPLTPQRHSFTKLSAEHKDWHIFV